MIGIELAVLALVALWRYETHARKADVHSEEVLLRFQKDRSALKEYVVRSERLTKELLAAERERDRAQAAEEKLRRERNEARDCVNVHWADRMEEPFTKWIRD